jgi:phosphoribosylformylglycinamidine cyclo-ligase
LDEDFGGMPLGLALLEPTRLYVKPVLALLEQVEVRGMAHITGGGFYENIPRMFCRPLDAVLRSPPAGADADAETGSAWTIPPIFARIACGVGGKPRSGPPAQKAGAELLENDKTLRKLMFNTFNMGIGFVLALAPGDSGRAIEFLDRWGYPAWEIGVVTAPRGAAGDVYFI